MSPDSQRLGTRVITSRRHRTNRACINDVSRSANFFRDHPLAQADSQGTEKRTQKGMAEERSGEKPEETADALIKFFTD